MKAIKVNIDYESVLFNNKSEVRSLNEALEFLAFYLDDRPVLTQKDYSAEFLNHIEELTGQRPQTVKTGDFTNWWGELKNFELERKLNSKKMSAEINIQEGWSPEMQLASSINDLKVLDPKKTYLVKDLFGMSGRNIQKIEGSNQEALKKKLSGNELLIEPLLNRKWDFSHYVFPNGNIICYENIVDHRFQYKGSLFNSIQDMSIENLSFYSKVSPDKWQAFQVALKKIIKQYRCPELGSGFSIDSFIYESEGELFIHYLSEVNYRKTMGFIAFELARKFSGKEKRVSLEFRKNPGTKFQERKKQVQNEGGILLSPEDAKFEIALVSQQARI